MQSAFRFSSRIALRGIRYNSSATPTTPPLLGQIRSDMKMAMRAKDSNRLNVLRAIISEVNNAAKTPSPIQTDIQLLSLIRKRRSAAQDAGRQFEEANRPDLKEKEDAQVVVLDEYAGQVQTVSEEDITAAVSETIAKLKEGGKKIEVGAVLKTLFGPGGGLFEKPAERSQVAQIAKQALSSS